MDAPTSLVLLLAVSWACGLNLYATVLTLGLLNANGLLALPPGLAFLSDPAVMTLAAILYGVEFLADKTPGVDSGWDALHTFIRIPAGALLALLAVGGTPPFAGFGAFLLGGTMASLSHFTKAGTRIAINGSPEPFSNGIASLCEDVIVVIGLLLAVYHPLLFTGLLLAFIALALWLLPRLWRMVRRLFSRLSGWWGTRRPAANVGTPVPRLPKP